MNSIEEMINLFQEQNKLLKKQNLLLKKSLCKCPVKGQWQIAGSQIFCPIHGVTTIPK